MLCNNRVMDSYHKSCLNIKFIFFCGLICIISEIFILKIGLKQDPIYEQEINNNCYNNTCYNHQVTLTNFLSRDIEKENNYYRIVYYFNFSGNSICFSKINEIYYETDVYKIFNQTVNKYNKNDKYPAYILNNFECDFDINPKDYESGSDIIDVKSTYYPYKILLILIVALFIFSCMTRIFFWELFCYYYKESCFDNLIKKCCNPVCEYYNSHRESYNTPKHVNDYDHLLATELTNFQQDNYLLSEKLTPAKKKDDAV